MAITMRIRHAALVLVAGAVCATATPAAADPTGVSVVGTGHVALTDFAVSVRAGATGESPTGSLVTRGYYAFTATPTCLSVAGSAGVSGYRVDSGEQAGQGFLASAQDGGPDGADRIIYSGFVPTPPTTCPLPSDAPPDFTASGGGGPLDAGELTVAGGPPASVPPWEPPSLPVRPVASLPGGDDNLLEPFGPLTVVPERGLGPLRLGTRPTAGGQATPMRVALDRRGRITRISATPTVRTRLYGRPLDPGAAPLRRVLRARGWRITRCGDVRTALHASGGRSTSITWRGARLVRVVIAAHQASALRCRARRR